MAVRCKTVISHAEINEAYIGIMDFSIMWPGVMAVVGEEKEYIFKLSANLGGYIENIGGI